MGYSEVVDDVTKLFRTNRKDEAAKVIPDELVEQIAECVKEGRLSEVSDVRVVILRLTRVPTIDATGASVLADTIKRLEGRNISVLLSGIRPEHVRVLSHLGVYDELAHERHIFATTPEAIEHARKHAHRIAHEAESGPNQT